MTHIDFLNSEKLLKNKNLTLALFIMVSSKRSGIFRMWYYPITQFDRLRMLLISSFLRYYVYYREVAVSFFLSKIS